MCRSSMQSQIDAMQMAEGAIAFLPYTGSPVGSRKSGRQSRRPLDGPRLFRRLLGGRQLIAVHPQFDRLVPATLADVELHRVRAEILQVDRVARRAHRLAGARLAVVHRDRLHTGRLKLLLGFDDVVDLEADVVDA